MGEGCSRGSWLECGKRTLEWPIRECFLEKVDQEPVQREQHCRLFPGAVRKMLHLYLQSLLVQHKDFGVAFDPLYRKLLDLQARIQAEKGLQRDLPGKQVQLLRLQVSGIVTWLTVGCAGAPPAGSKLQSSGQPDPKILAADLTGVSVESAYSAGSSWPQRDC